VDYPQPAKVVTPKVLTLVETLGGQRQRRSEP